MRTEPNEGLVASAPVSGPRTPATSAIAQRLRELGWAVAPEPLPYYLRDKGDDGVVIAFRLSDGDPREALTHVTARLGPLWRLRSESERFMVDRRIGVGEGAPYRPDLDEDAGLLLLPFPLDRRLAHTHRLLESGKVRRLVESSGVLADARRIHATGARARVASYRPERRIVVEWTFPWTDPAGGSGTYRVYLRQANDSDVLDRAQRVLRALESARLPTPRALLRASANVALESAVEGEPIAGLASTQTLSAAGAILARIHRVRPPHGLPRWDREALTERARDRAQDLHRLDAALGRRALQLTEALQGAAVGPSEHVFLHGDAHEGQFLQSPQGMSVVDWDRAALGSPAFDFGTFYAHLVMEAPMEAERRAEFLRAGYARTESPPAEREVAWHRAACVLALADTPYRRCRPRWQKVVETLLQSAEQHLRSLL